MNTVTQVRPFEDIPEKIERAKVVSIDRCRQEACGETDLFSLDERISYIKMYGDRALSFSTLQPGMHYFDIPGVGFISYMKKWGGFFVLSDPICDAKDQETMLRGFLKDGKNATFVQISQEIGELLHAKFGYYATQFGVETVVDLEAWDLKGKKKQILRTSVNHARKEGIVISESCTEDMCRQLTDDWLKTRKVKNREIGFLIRPMNMEFQEGTRKFYAYQNGQLIGFIYFDPIYSNNNLIGYVPNISRFSSKFKAGIFYPLMVHAMETFKKEGVKYLNIGLCPLAAGDDDLPCESLIQKRMNRLLYRHANWIFSFKGLYFTKSRFGGRDQKIFGGTKRKLPAFEFFTLFRICNIL
jgi:phosphatidylglycerol lysyltransferase